MGGGRNFGRIYFLGAIGTPTKVPKWSPATFRKHFSVSLFHSEMGPKRFQNAPEMGAKWVRAWVQDGSKMDPGWVQNRIQDEVRS